jgi:GNAT superfamily N-acetyltransferase
VNAAEAFYRTLDLAAEWELSPHAHPSLVTRLARRGYVPVSFRNVYAHDLRAIPAAPAGIVVDRIAPDELPTWSAVLLDGFGYTSPADRSRVEGWNRMLLERPEASLFLASAQGDAVGAGNVLIHGATASLGGTSVRPPARRRGVQAALLVARLVAARDAGATLAVVTADPGSASARNVERAGFRLAATNLRVRPRGGAGPTAVVSGRGRRRPRPVRRR